MTTIWADWGFLFIVGLIFGWAASRQIQGSGSLFLNRCYLSALLFQTVFCMPLAIYCYLIYPDWCWMYWLDADQVPRVWVILAFLGYYAAMTLGFGVSARAEQKKPGLGRKILDYALIVFPVLLVIFSRRLFWVGSLEQFRAGALPFLARQEPLFVLLIFGFALAISALIYILADFGRELDWRWSGEDREKFERRKRVVSLARVEDELKSALKKSLDAWDGLVYLKELLDSKSSCILLKLNLAGGGRGMPGTQTSAGLLAALIDLIREAAPRAEILAVESASIFWWDLDPCYLGSEQEKVLKEKGVKFVNLSREPLVERDLGGRFGKDKFPALLFEPHLLIDLPVAKTHAYYKMSGALKNLLGLTPAGHKLLLYHTKGFADPVGQIFLDLYRNFTPDLVVIDGIVSGEGEGPFGSPKTTDFILSSDDAICADWALAEIMGYPIKAIPYLSFLDQAGLSPNFQLRGVPLQEIKPPDWKKPSSRAWSLLVNFFRIQAHHFRLKLTRAGKDSE